MPRPLGISLGIDFTRFDRDLNAIASKIEDAGKSASVKVGAIAAGGGLDAQQMGASVEQIGTRLAVGIASGVRSASALMLGFTAHIDQVLNRVAGAAVTIFQRIDAAMKFPAFDAFFTRATARVKNFTAIWRKPLSDLDLAIAGGFGGTVASAARVLKVLVESLAQTIATALKDAVASVVGEFGRLSGGIGRAEASAQGLLETVEKTAKASQFNMGSGGFKGTVGGRRIGVGLTAPAATPAPTLGLGDPRRGAIPGGSAELMAVARASQLAALGVAKVGAAFVSIPLGIITPLMRVRNFMGSLGSVTKQTFDEIFKGGVRIASLGILGKADQSAKGFNRTMGETKSSLDQIGSSVRSVGLQIAAAFGVVGVLYKAVQFFRDGVKGASDLNETVSRSKVVFGESFGVVQAQASGMARAFGLSRKAQLDVASGFGAMAQGAGMSEAKSASLANQLTKMAADLSSSVNIPFEEAGDKIRSALAGQSEPLRQFGVNITEQAVQAYALSSGLAKSAKAIDEQAKMAARAALIMRGLGYAQGDLERTSGSAANQFRKAGGGLTEFGTRIGELLLPAIQSGTEAFNTLLGAVLDVFDAGQPIIQSWAASAAAAMEKVGMVARNLGSFFKIAQLRVGEFVINTIGWIETIPANFGPVTEWLGRNWQNLLIDFANMTSAAFTNLLDNATRFGVALWEALKGNGFEFTWTPLLDGFKATTEQLPELIKPALISVDDEVNRLWAEIGKNEADRAASLAKAGTGAVKKPGPITDAAKTAEPKLASAVEIGSKEASSIIARAANSPAAKHLDVAKQHAETAKQSNQELKAIRQAILDRPLIEIK